MEFTKGDNSDVWKIIWKQKKKKKPLGTLDKEDFVINTHTQYVNLLFKLGRQCNSSQVFSQMLIKNYTDALVPKKG